MAEDNSATAANVEIHKDGEILATVRYSEGAGMSAEIGPCFDSCVRVWFDRVDDTGSLIADGRHIGRVREGILAAFRRAGEAAMWEAMTGDVSTLADGRNEWDEVSYVEVCE